MSSMPDPGSQFQELLFHELHHRFYNSLQLVSATLRLLALDHQRPETILRLLDRIGMLGGLHRILARPPADRHDIQASLRALCASLVEGYGCGTVVLHIDSAPLPDDPMIVRGLTLILIELVTNALKCGASDATKIQVRLAGAHDCCFLTVTNQASPHGSWEMRAPYDATRFTEAMGGTLTVAPGPNYEVHVTLPLTRCGFVIHGEFHETEN